MYNDISYLCASLTNPPSVYVKDVLQLFETQPDTALILLVPVRLGSESLNPIYIPCIQGLLALDCCVGIIGGRPKHSVFFIGFQGDRVCCMCVFQGIASYAVFGCVCIYQ